MRWLAALALAFTTSPAIAQDDRAHMGGEWVVDLRDSDGNGAYHSGACLVDGKLIGQTWSEGRGFVLPWTAERP